jgi:hypothetical protein
LIVELNTKIIKLFEISKLFFKKFFRVSLIGLGLPMGSDPLGYARIPGDPYNP